MSAKNRCMTAPEEVLAYFKENLAAKVLAQNNLTKILASFPTENYTVHTVFDNSDSSAHKELLGLIGVWAIICLKIGTREIHIRLQVQGKSYMYSTNNFPLYKLNGVPKKELLGPLSKLWRVLLELRDTV